MLNNFYVYELIDPRTSLPFYIGKGSGKRAFQHLKTDLSKDNPRKQRLIEKIRINGFEPFVNIIISNLYEHDAFAKEVLLIKKHGRIGFEKNGILTNLTLGGEGISGHKFSKESKEKLSKSHFANKISDDISLNDIFINEAMFVHGNKYDYSAIEYINNSTKVKIICKKHGIFEQKPSNHLSGKGCRKCGLLKRSASKILTTENFITKATKIHDNTYDYSKVIHKSHDKKILIHCYNHGEFEQSPTSHLSGHGCYECSKIYGSNKRRRRRKIV